MRKLFGTDGLFRHFDVGEIMQLGAGNESLDNIRVSSLFNAFYETDPY